MFDGASPQKSGVRTPGRVDAVHATRLLDTGPEEAFNRLTRIAAIVLRTPMIALTVADDLRAGGVEHLAGGGMILGLAPGVVIGMQRLELATDDELVLCTDGVTEAHRVGDPDQLDESGLAAVLAALPPGHPPQETAEALLGAARARADGRSPGDAGVVVVRIGNPAAAGGYHRR